MVETEAFGVSASQAASTVVLRKYLWVCDWVSQAGPTGAVLWVLIGTIL